jgi:hypothetical protein
MDRRILVINEATLSNAELLSDKVDSGDFLRNWVLDLKSGVDFKKRNGSVFTNEELTRPGTYVASFFENGFG